MRVHLLLGAGVAAALLSAGCLVAGPAQVRSCATANAAVDAGNARHQDALRALDRADVRRRHDGDSSGMDSAQRRVDETKRELDAARAERAALCP